jgi:hypothetical protein
VGFEQVLRRPIETTAVIGKVAFRPKAVVR